MSSDTDESLLPEEEAEILRRKAKAARGLGGDQIIIYRDRPDGNGKRLNSIILAIASVSLCALGSIIWWKVEKVGDKVDAVNERLIRVETTVGVKP